MMEKTDVQSQKTERAANMAWQALERKKAFEQSIGEETSTITSHQPQIDIKDVNSKIRPSEISTT